MVAVCGCRRAERAERERGGERAGGGGVRPKAIGLEGEMEDDLEGPGADKTSQNKHEMFWKENK